MLAFFQHMLYNILVIGVCVFGCILRESEKFGSFFNVVTFLGGILNA